MEISTLRPGLLVSLKTSIKGNVHYAKRIVASEHVNEAGEQKLVWETARTITDPVEFDVAKKARDKAAGLVRRVCAPSEFGLLCPEESTEKLSAAVAEARKITEAFNVTARLSRLSVFVVSGRIAPDDVEAVRAINSEVRDLLDAMSEGIKNLDVKRVREAAAKARSIGAMLSPSAQDRIKVAIDSARAVATKMRKAGEQAAAEIDLATLNKLTAARTAFLDLDPAVDVAAPAAEAREIDLAPVVPVNAVAPVLPVLEME